MSARKQKVSYFYDPDFGQYYFGPEHAMKPFRANMTWELILNYGLHERMSIYNPRLLSNIEMTKFHTDDYVAFLQQISPSDATITQEDTNNFSIGEDCPPFVGIFPYCQRSCGGSVTGAAHLNAGHSDIAVNWMGGMHHAKRNEASGFCYANDIVLGILELLKVHARVLYIDIDIHHGDGVEEAFYTTDRVMTVSFHKHGNSFFPGTGDLGDVGAEDGSGYAVNVALNDGMDDESYTTLFKAVIRDVMEHFRPGAIVLQCGADSLANDRLGCFNLTIGGHGECVDFVKSLGLPLMVLGGGGYTLRNVARCWAYETALCVGASLPEEVPHHRFYEYYAPDYSLNLVKNNQQNLNSKRDLEKIYQKIHEQLQSLAPAPGVGLAVMPKPQECDLQADIDMAEDGAGNIRVSQTEADLSRTMDAEDRQGLRMKEFVEQD
ncbi:Histone deacetylase superfamily [Carpediemonas membranifera]|uniref:Histone deacetylase n=1 Tax=Carpediemonas membranifera TaxID=201153 RepID=A0A8J6BBX1_9EUKA|nr:Histone deacetylase superfamily [Carpediemonas membranifera]|eukprot:KAG9397574.1 Histone deacetylase superfamily [Carpediemonas membranifera]